MTYQKTKENNKNYFLKNRIKPLGNTNTKMEIEIIY